MPLLTLAALATIPTTTQPTRSRELSVDEGDKQLSDLQLVHIPKAGGTTLEDFGLNRLDVRWGIHREHWPGGSCPYGCDGNASWQPCSSWHIPRTVFTEVGPALARDGAGRPTSQDPYAGYKTFCALRHPFTRAISEYIFSWGPCNSEDLNAGLTAVLREISTPLSELSSAWPHISGSTDQLRTVSKVLFPQDGRPSSDCHMLPQSFYDCDIVMHTETLDVDFASLMRSYGADVTADSIPTSNQAGCSLPVGALNSTTLELLRQVYARDFEVGGYSPDVLPSRAAAARDHARDNIQVNDRRVAVFADDLVEESPWVPESDSDRIYEQQMNAGLEPSSS